jgi:DNA-binding NarL/FixJ family response regulator
VPPALALWQSAWRYLAAGLISLVTWGEVVEQQAQSRPIMFWLELVAGLSALALCHFRRRYPLPIAASVIALSSVFSLAAGPATLALVSLSTRRLWREIIPVTALSLLAGGVYLLAQPEAVSPWLASLLLTVLFTAVSVAVGLYVAGMTSAGIRVVLADDDPLVRAGLSMILNGADDIEIVGEARDCDAAVEQARRTKPDVVLMDIRMPRLDGLEATRRIVALPSAPRVIVLTTFDADEYVARALADGATGFLLKDTRPEDIVDGVRRAARGEPILSPSVTAQLIRTVTGKEFGAASPRSDDAQQRLSRLSERERDVAIAVGQGKSNAEIAADLYLSVATVKAYVSRLLDKLGAANRVQIAICVHEAGLV